MENAKLFQKRKKKTGIPGKRRVQSKCERKKCGLQLFVESPGTTAYEMFSCITRLVLNAKLSNPQGKDGRGDVKLSLNDRQREKKKCKCG
ncbi:hypothetical protein Y032_0206g1993 [Ancylostoma ceylanicum]|uniref:Uncharacterized protein n=1 Tax=Ancylostoma ceylanicum TaxID=53326 RepID=A0A016SL40_9BILA|nr:hypothetical protein Y032_0206g1993 [Ancylostoma ceylanicum]